MSSPHQRYASPPPIEGEGQFGTSPTFGPADAGGTRSPTNLVLISSDLIQFHVDEATLTDKSINSFKDLLPLPLESSSRSLFLADIPSAELEVVLQAIYDVEINISPSIMEIKTLIRAMDQLITYGFPPSTCIVPHCHLYQYLLSCATIHPLGVYAAAAHHGIASLAVAASSHTLALPDLSVLDDDFCTQMGAIYLLRLFQLHIGRIETLKQLLSDDLGLHNPNPICGFEGQKVLKGMWSLAVAEIFPNLRANTTTSTIRTAIMSHTADNKCIECANLRDTRLNRIISEWSMTPRNITE
ncbi:hypothetical protein AAF712_008631 [Marasmius tenuissimus]|uniref:BTB domain-containing protein n=1 Tax=Marasmius tenuissimus TaxID=585030 RepID=A0ABR2ZVZ5_9AGAR